MNREYPNTPLQGVLAAVVKDGKLLLVQRSKEPDKGKWGLPGGLLEEGETLSQAAIRELWEETTVKAQGDSIIDRFEVNVDRGRFIYQLAVVKLEWQSGEAMAASDAAAVGWFDQKEIAEIPHSYHLPRLAGLLLGR